MTIGIFRTGFGFARARFLTTCLVCGLAVAVRDLTLAAPASMAHAASYPDAPTVAGCPITALPNDGSTTTQEVAPNLRKRFGRAVYLILQSELEAAGITSGTSFSAIGWSFQTAPGLTGQGPLIVYLQNTADTTNTKSNTWNTAIAGMTIVHNVTTNIPNVTGPWDVQFLNGSPFTYTGGGLYVAFDMTYGGTQSSTTLVSCNSTGHVSGTKGAESNTSPPATISNRECRPETRFTPPLEVQNVAAAADKVTYSWLPVPGATRFDVVRGSLSELPVGPGGGDEVCFDDLEAPTLNDPQVPAPDSGFWYLPRAENSFCNGPYGVQSNGSLRITGTCP